MNLDWVIFFSHWAEIVTSWSPNHNLLIPLGRGCYCHYQICYWHYKIMQNFSFFHSPNCSHPSPTSHPNHTNPFLQPSALIIKLPRWGRLGGGVSHVRRVTRLGSCMIWSCCCSSWRYWGVIMVRWLAHKGIMVLLACNVQRNHIFVI